MDISSKMQNVIEEQLKEIEEKENLPMMVKYFLNYLETIKGKSINTIVI